MSSSIVSDSNGSGQLRWSFGAADSDFDFLARNERLILTYDVVVRDNHGGTATRTVTVTITGTDDKPIIEFGATAEVTEQAGHTLSLSPDTACSLEPKYSFRVSWHNSGANARSDRQARRVGASRRSASTLPSASADT